MITEKPTPRETAILLLAAQGYSNRRIGHALGISPRSVRNCFDEEIMPRYGARNRTEAVVRAMMLGDITPPLRGC